MRKILILLLLAEAAWSQPLSQQNSASWTSATAQGSTLALQVAGYNCVTVGFTVSGTISSGLVTFQASTNGGTSYPFTPTGYSISSQASVTTISLSGSANAYQVPVAAFTNFQLFLSNAITNTGTATLTIQASQGSCHIDAVTATVSGTVTATQGNQGTQGWFSIPVLPPVTSGSTTVLTYYMPPPYTTNATATGNTYNQLSLTARNVWGYDVQNPNSTVCWLEFYNNATPTLGATRVYGVPILPSGGISRVLPSPINFATALAIATTTADAGGTTCSTGMGVTIYYQ